MDGYNPFSGTYTEPHHHPPQPQPPSAPTTPTVPAIWLDDLADILASDRMATTPEAKDAGRRIGAAIKNTFEWNAIGFPWLVYKAGADFVGRLFRLGHGEQRAYGYFCHQWAYAFKNAVLLEDPTQTYFEVRVQRCDRKFPGKSAERFHYWIEIKSVQTKNCVYIDDGFVKNRPGMVHFEPPICYDYPPYWSGISEEESGPPRAHGHDDLVPPPPPDLL